MKKKCFSLRPFSNLLLLCLTLSYWPALKAQDLAYHANKSIKNPIPPGFMVKGKVSDNTGPIAGVTVAEKEKNQCYYYQCRRQL